MLDGPQLYQIDTTNKTALCKELGLTLMTHPFDERARLISALSHGSILDNFKLVTSPQHSCPCAVEMKKVLWEKERFKIVK